MTEKLYSLDEIMRAIDDNTSPGTGFNVTIDKEGIIEQLTRPQPEFREGQVVFNEHSRRDQYHVYGSKKEACNKWCRPLTPEEVGPGYVPVEDVRPLVKAAATCIAPGATRKNTAELCADAYHDLPDNLKGLIDE